MLIYMLRVTISMQEILDVVRYSSDLVVKITIAKILFLACLLVIHVNLCSQKFTALPDYNC